MTDRYTVRIEGLMPTLEFDSFPAALQYIETTHYAIMRGDPESRACEPTITLIGYHQPKEALLENE